MSKREREERSKDKKKKKKLKKSPEYVVLRALKKNDLSRARGILCVFTQAIFEMIDDCPPNFEDWSNLMFGAFLGYVIVVKVLIQKGADVNAVVDDVERGEMTALHIAADNGRVDVVKVLLQNGADVNAVASYNTTVLHTAAWKGHVSVVKVLIQNSADVNALDGGNWTPLLHAAENGQADVAKVLIQNGADVNAVTKGIWSALHLGARDGFVDFAKVLLQNGADMTILSVKNETPLCVAAKWGNVAYALQLLCFGAVIDNQALVNDNIVLLRSIEDRLKSLRAGNGMKTTLMSDEERRFMWNLAFSFTITYRVAALKAYYAVRSFITYNGIFMGPGYELGDGSVWRKEVEVEGIVRI